MALHLEMPQEKQETMIHWADDSPDEDDTISSEKDTGSEYDGKVRNRTTSIQEIWDDRIILKQLQQLPEAEDILELFNRDELGNILKKNTSTSLLIASYLGKETALKALLETGAPITTIDQTGLTALHLAAISGNVDCLKLLIDYGIDLETCDFFHKATALHCAANKGHLQCLKVLIRAGADVNSGLTVKSPLLYATESGALDCVRELLENNATPNTPQVFSQAPLHVAASQGTIEIVKLLLKYGAAVNVQCGPEKQTPLHLAAEDGDAECARLLIEAGAQISARNHKDQTPLHLAAISQSSETLELLLVKGADPNTSDKDGRTPLHSAIVKVSRSCECVRLLLKFGANVNKSDTFGYTPIHLAALNEFSNCVMLLLNNGGDVTVRTNGGVSVLTFITRKTPDVIPKYISKFNSSILVNDHEIGDVDCELKLDFRILVPTMGNKETELLLNFIEVGHREILKHPLCETFLFLKWRRIRKFFLFSLFYHSLFVLLYSFYVVGVFLKDCPSKRKMVHTCDVPNYVKFFGYILLIFNIILLGKELFQMLHCWRAYIKQWENWLQWLIILSVFCCVQPTESMNIEINVDNWQHHVAAIGIFLAWVELMMIVGRFPIFGLYIQMFTTVSINFTKFIVAYFCLLLAFAFSFGVLFPNYKSFKDLKWVVLKVIVMMSGELEYEDIFFDNSAPIIYKSTAQIMFLTFVILVTVILTNLMVGLAVSDIQGLQQSAGLDRLVRQTELVAHLESMLFSRLLKCIPHKLMKFFHKQALLLKSQYHWALYIKPNDPREERIPKDIIRNIYHLIAERKERPKSRKKRSSNLSASPLTRTDSCTSYGFDYKNREIRNQLEEILMEFQDYSRVFKQKIENVSRQINVKL